MIYWYILETLPLEWDIFLKIPLEWEKNLRRERYKSKVEKKFRLRFNWLRILGRLKGHPRVNQTGRPSFGLYFQRFLVLVCHDDLGFSVSPWYIFFAIVYSLLLFLFISDYNIIMPTSFSPPGLVTPFRQTKTLLNVRTSTLNLFLISTSSPPKIKNQKAKLTW